MLKLNKNIKLILNYVVGPLVFCLLAFSIYIQIQRQPDWRQSYEIISASFAENGYFSISMVSLLMIVNWAIEARKWQVAIDPLYRLRFFSALKAIFTGTTLAFFTPNRMGEYFGRMLYLKRGTRFKSISVTIVCSMAQLLVTLLAGLIGLQLVMKDMRSHPEMDDLVIWLNIIFFAVLAGAALLTILFFRLSFFVKILDRVPSLHRFAPYIQVLEGFNATILLRLLSLSIARYAVFIAQYFILFQLFRVEIDWWQCFCSMSVVFLILAIVPSIALLTELGIRWKASIELVTLYSANAVGILATSLAIWVINLVIPALIGSLLILGLRFFVQSEGRRKKPN